MPEPAKNKLVQAVDDMGEFRAEFPASRSFRLSWCYAKCCAVFFAFLTMSFVSTFHRILMAEYRNGPSEPVFFCLIYVLLVCGFPLAFFLAMFFTIKKFRRAPMFVALFDYGLFLVFPFGSTKQIFRNEIDQVEIVRGNDLFETSIPYRLEITMNATPKPLSIPIRQIQNAEELCRRILSEMENRNPSS